MNSQQIRPCDPTQQAAKVAVAPPARDQLEHLCRYLLRPPLTVERLTESSHGQLLYELPHPRRDGSTHLLLDPLELIEKLSVLVAAPRFHLLRFHGGMAPPAAWRSQVIRRPSAATSQAIDARVANAGPSAVAARCRPVRGAFPGRRS
jgi:Putative transposase